MQSIPYDLSSFHKDAKPVYLVHTKPSGLLGDVKKEVIMIPPLNTDIFMKSVLDRHAEDRKKLGATRPAIPLKELPGKYIDSFNWKTDRQLGQTDDINRNITPVGNQYGCGCCWAFSTADAVSDVFVQSNTLPANPRCSVTYILSCFPHCDPNGICSDPNASYQCGGGQIATTLVWISKHGVGSLDCMDYSWCSSNNSCVSGSSDEVSLNQSIPECRSRACKELYYIENPRSVGLQRGSSTEDMIKQRDYIKKWVYSVGTILTGFFVYQNLFVGTFRSDKNPDNIYLEDVDYGTHELFSGGRENRFAGGHAVCVIGWGQGRVDNSLISDATLRSDGSFTTVPYWIVRNSWSDKWGDSGLFRMAMYPFNKISQFDADVSVRTNQGSGSAGGLVIFEPSKRTVPQTVKDEDDDHSSCSTTARVLLWVVIMITILAIIFYLKLRKDRKRK